MGTVCVTWPMNRGNTAETSSRVTVFAVRSSSPVRSPLSEVKPKRSVPTYSLGKSTKKRASLVARPTSTMRSPVANGSSVPA